MLVLPALTPSQTRCFLSFLVLLLLPGCGGGGGGNGGGGAGGTTTTAVQASVHWAARSRTLNAPSSALSMVATLHNAAPGGGDFAFTVNRDASPAAYTTTYTSTTLAKIGTWDFAARFYAGANGTGDVVGTASATVTITAAGTGIGDITTVGTVASVAVPANQTVAVGASKDLVFEARTASGSLLALSAGSAFFTLTGGSDKMSVTQSGLATGLAPGNANVTATVDGIASAAQTVAVTSSAVVSISPSSPTIYVNGTQTFTATVTNAPTNAVTWQLANSPAAGTLSADGLYTAPNAAGNYTITATSTYDPAKSASVVVYVLPNTVTIGSGNVDLNIGDQRQLSATVNGVLNAPVTWSLQEGAAAGAISASGLYTAPATAGTYHVVAESQAFPGVTGSATIHIHTGDVHIIIH